MNFIKDLLYKEFFRVLIFKILLNIVIQYDVIINILFYFLKIK